MRWKYQYHWWWPHRIKIIMIMIMDQSQCRRRYLQSVISIIIVLIYVIASIMDYTQCRRIYQYIDINIIIDMICHTILINVSSSSTTNTIKMIKHLDKHVRLWHFGPCADEYMKIIFTPSHHINRHLEIIWADSILTRLQLFPIVQSNCGWVPNLYGWVSNLSGWVCTDANIT